MGFFGGGAGAIQDGDADVHYPDYLENFHQALMAGGWDGTNWTDNLLYSVVDAINANSTWGGGSPYAGVAAYDPSSDLDDMQSRFDDFDNLVTALDPEVDLETALAFANAQVDPTAELADIDDYVDALETREKGAFNREVARVTSGMFDIRGVMTSQFGMVLSSMEDGRRNSLDANDKEMRLQAFNRGQQLKLGIADTYLRQKSQQIELNRVAVAMQSDLSRLKITGYGDELAMNLEMATRDGTWDLELLEYAKGGMAAITGAAMVPRTQTPRERLMGALTTALSTGLQAGVATTSPLLGLGAGLLNFATQMWAMH
jgi:hypothetical protein